MDCFWHSRKITSARMEQMWSQCDLDQESNSFMDSAGVNFTAYKTFSHFNLFWRISPTQPTKIGWMNNAPNAKLGHRNISWYVKVHVYFISPQGLSWRLLTADGKHQYLSLLESEFRFLMLSKYAGWQAPVSSAPWTMYFQPTICLFFFFLNTKNIP